MKKNYRDIYMFTMLKTLSQAALLAIAIASCSTVPSASTNTSANANNWAQLDTIVASIVLPKIPKRDVNIRDFAAQPGPQHNALPAINQAIDEAVQHGGGRIIIPPGVWHVQGPIHLQSNINLHIQEGATLLFVGAPSHYLPAVKQRWEGTEVFNYSPMIYAHNVHDVAITGKGTIDGNRDSPFHGWHKKQAPDIAKLRKMGFSGVPVAQRVFEEGSFLRPGLIQIFAAQRVLFEGFTALNSPFWVNHVVAAKHVTVRNLIVKSHFPNNDGIDIESSEYVLVEGCTFRTGDDSVAIKSGRDLDGRRIGLPSRKIVVRNNDMGGEDGIGVGSEMSGGIRDVFFTDNVMRNGDSAFRFKANLDRGGTVERVFVRNSQIDEFKHLFWFQLNYPSEHGGKFKTTYKDIEFSNISAKKIGTTFFIRGTAEFPPQNIRFKNITVTETKHLFDIQNARDLQFSDVVIGSQKFDGVMNWENVTTGGEQ